MRWRAAAWWGLPAAILVGLAAPLAMVGGSGPDLMSALLPPAFALRGRAEFLLGTDAQGRDMLMATLVGLRLSLAVAVLAVGGAVVLGAAAGLCAGRAGGIVDGVVMRAADVQTTFPALLVALLADGALRLGAGRAALEGAGVLPSVLILGAAIALGRWAPIARLVRAGTRREWRRDYVAASRLAGASAPRVLVVHVIRNLAGSVLVLAAVDVGLAVMDEAALSYLGLGLPPDRPSLGTLIRSGQEVMTAGAWWVVAVPGVALVGVVGAAELCAGLARRSLLAGHS